MADVSGMDMVLFDPIEGDYQEGGGSGKSYAPPPEGKYFGTLPLITDENFTKTGENYFAVNLDPITIVNPNGAGDGYTIRFTKSSAKKYTNRNGSPVLDVLRAAGVNAPINSVDELKAWLKAISGKTVQFAIQWEAYDKAVGQTVAKGEENFPMKDDGTGRQPWVESSSDPEKRVFANGKIRYFISSVGK